MNNTRGSTPPNPTLDLPNRSTDLCKTLGIVGTPHGHSIAKIWSTKTCKIKRNRGNPTKNACNPRAKKTPKSSPFAHGLGRGIKGKRTTKDSRIHPPPNPKEKGLEITPKKSPRKGSENHQKGQRVRHIQALRNHSESSIHTKEVHTRSSLLPVTIPSKIIPYYRLNHSIWS
jgi:hypothetical protein